MNLQLVAVESHPDPILDFVFDGLTSADLTDVALGDSLIGEPNPQCEQHTDFLAESPAPLLPLLGAVVPDEILRSL